MLKHVLVVRGTSCSLLIKEKIKNNLRYKITFETSSEKSEKVILKGKQLFQSDEINSTMWHSSLTLIIIAIVKCHILA